MRNEPLEDRWISDLAIRQKKNWKALGLTEMKDVWEINPEEGKKEFNGSYIDKNGIIRWKSNDQVPPDHCLSVFAHLGLITWKTAKESNAIQEQETNAFLTKAYQNLPDETDADDEFMFEARAALGNDIDGLINPIGMKLDAKRKKWIKIK